MALFFALAACQQPAAHVQYDSGKAVMNDTYIATPTRSVAPPNPKGSAGKEAANYYQQQRQPAARIGGSGNVGATSGYTAPQAYAPPRAYNPAPVRSTNNAPPFGRPSAPLPLESAPGPGASLQVPQAVPYAQAAPVSDAQAQARFQAMVAGDALSTPEPAVMPVSAPALAAVTPAAGFGDYAGSMAFSGAAPSLPPAAPPPSNFVINGAGEPVKGIHAAAPEHATLTQAEAAPSIMPVSTQATAPKAPANTDATLSWPLRGQILSGFGPKNGGRSNDGINIAAPAGTAIQAAADGMVVYAGNELPGYGNMLVLSHAGNRTTVYAHASALKVKKGDFVHKGQTVALVGQTGGVTKPQLHFALREGNTPINPVQMLPR